MSTKKIILLDEVDKNELQIDIDGKAPRGHKHSTSDVIGPLPVSKGGLGLSTLHTNQVFYTSEQNVVSQLGSPTEPSVLVQGTKTIHNLLGRSGMFDKSDFDDETSIDQRHVKYGSYSLKLTSGSNQSYKLNPKNENSVFYLNPSHNYYVRVEEYKDSARGSVKISWPAGTPYFLSGQVGPARQWNLVSAVSNRRDFSAGYYPLTIFLDNVSSNVNFWLDGLMLIDLTADFGAGNEPDKVWCDANLPYFSNKYNIKYDKPYWKPLNDIGIKSVVTLKGRENTTFTVSLKGKVVARGQIGQNGISVIELKETGEYAIHAERNGIPHTSTFTINYTGTYEVDINIEERFSMVSTAAIPAITKAGLASSIWAIGDTREVKLNGTVGAHNFLNYTTYMFIVAFDHNSSVEMNGEHHIVCSFAKSAATGGEDIAFTDTEYNNDPSSPSFHMNSSEMNSGGWQSSYMRQTICSQFKNAMPSELQAVLRTRTIYTDNTGGRSGNNSSSVTATTDTVYIPSEFEVQGSCSYGNAYEYNYQQQLAYYKNGASTIRYKSEDTSETAFWWCRSPSYDEYSFCYMSTDGETSYDFATWSYGFAPLITL